MPPLVVVTPYNRGGGSSRVRVYDWLDHLGLDAEVHDYRGTSSNPPNSLARQLISTVRAESTTRSLDVTGRRLLISREASPLSSGRLEARLLTAAGRGVYDVDDALFHDTRPGVRRVLGKSATWSRAVAAADVVVAGNDYLAERASRTARQVVVIPSCVEPADYPEKSSYMLCDPPRLVWVGSPSTEPFLRSIAPSLLEVHRRTGARLTVVSAGSATLGPLDAIVDRLPWALDSVASALSASDVAIGPLTDSPYARGKCAYKLLQYAAAGLPMVGSPVGANAAALEAFGGTAERSASGWTEALVGLLAAGDDVRARLGTLARRGVDEHYSFARWAATWRAAVLGT
jgi:glycosyltransferase involved in cell wall biosynthesis